ncbi:MAG: hypothetical protein WBL80_05450 [Erysipelotrichaceae bacterium]
MKDAILATIQETMQELGLVVKPAENADLFGEAEFLDASFTSSKKPIAYKVWVSADTRDQTVYLYETADGVNENIAAKKVKRIISKPYGRTEIVRMILGDIPKAVKSALGEEWKVRSVNSVQKVEFAKGGFELFEKVEPEAEIEIPVFKAHVEEVQESRPIRLERSDVNLYYLGLVVMFMLIGMVLDITSVGYIAGLSVWVVFLFVHRHYKQQLTIRIFAWVVCLILLMGILYLTIAK